MKEEGEDMTVTKVDYASLGSSEGAGHAYFMEGSELVMNIRLRCEISHHLCNVRKSQ